MREATGLLEAPQVRRKSEPPRPEKPPRRWSPTAFEAAWDAAKERDPKLRTRHLSDPCDVDPATIRNWRRGKGQPSADQWLALAAVLGVDPFELTEPNR